jgi:hypothetical protein
MAKCNYTKNRLGAQARASEETAPFGAVKNSDLTWLTEATADWIPAKCIGAVDEASMDDGSGAALMPTRGLQQDDLGAVASIFPG